MCILLWLFLIVPSEAETITFTMPDDQWHYYLKKFCDIHDCDPSDPETPRALADYIVTISTAGRRHSLSEDGITMTVKEGIE